MALRLGRDPFYLILLIPITAISLLTTYTISSRLSIGVVLLQFLGRS
jgi:hypothetical protein